MTKKEKLVDLLRQDARLSNEQLAAMLDTSADDVAAMKIGRASCRERV